LISRANIRPHWLVVLANCPKFLLGKGPFDIINTWAGLVDELRVLPWAMDEAEIGTFVAANYAPSSSANQHHCADIDARRFDRRGHDDGRPVPPGSVTLSWSQMSVPFP